MFPRRVVITGIGAVSPIGNDLQTIEHHLRHSISGIRSMPEYAELGMRSQIAGKSETERTQDIPRKLKRFMGEESQLAYVAMEDAIAHSGLDSHLVKHPRTGLIMGSGGASTKDIVEAADALRNKGIKKVGPYRVTSTMTNTVSACLSTGFGITGLNFSVSSACATSAHCIGLAAQMIAWGEQDIVFAGGAESEHWSKSALFDAMQAMSTGFNQSPQTASRAYDQHRDGFVIASGAGVLVLESLEHAERRNAHIIAELTGYGTASDGADMVSPSGEGSQRSMMYALEQYKGQIDYLNTHATSTPLGDDVELEACKKVFHGKLPPLSSTKSLTGHSLGAAGVHEAIYSLIMLSQGFMAASANIETIDPKMADQPILRETIDAKLKTVMSNSFGFGGTNVSLIFSAPT
ncbi:beta-ketoacyl synthase N-terminal-like domain-containing protein [Gynuella sp.]|uniref:beta-ketoacyl synthase N-terminal-like domain-containing protein n=1 Tax=Gynuella sp. TaxID=2969146 RepID=UPI003D0DAD03